MDMSQALTVLESLRWAGMTPLEIAEMEQFRYANPRPTHKDISQILAMLERFGLVKREAIGDSTTSNWRALPHARGVRNVEELSALIQGGIQEGALLERERLVLEAMAEMGGRSDLASLRARLPGGPVADPDELFQALAELMSEGLISLGWGQTEVDWPWLRLTRRGWTRSLGLL